MCRLDVYCPKQMIECPWGGYEEEARNVAGETNGSRDSFSKANIFWGGHKSVLRDIVGSDAEAVISDTDSETNSNSDGYPYSDSESDMISESLSEDDMISESLSEDDATAELEFIPGTMEQLIQSLLNSIDEEDS
ncbi:hypothetical protein TNCT_260781 [Trichonephila clavata]|uniref:Uncharacterized protein n=1 Tax=Trichonephila clavata TaxID=2740835 RepID=A0A8X6K1M6_TRICU|nr:hypothetical protein TNCT_260781 [Trichonephila clavata]